MRSSTFLLICAALWAVTLAAFAATTAEPPPVPAASPSPQARPEDEMFRVQLVMLRAGPKQEQVAANDPRQAEHLAGLERLMKESKALIVGPVEGEGDLRGLVVLDVATRAEAEQLMAGDPWIKAGHLVAEYRTWFVAKRVFRRLVGPFMDVEPCTFALLKRPAGAPTLSETRSKEVQAGHMANIDAMAAAGELLVAGPLVEDTPLRGIFVFKTRDPARIAELVARDPAVQLGRLVVEPHTWWVSKGVLPAH